MNSTFDLSLDFTQSRLEALIEGLLDNSLEEMHLEVSGMGVDMRRNGALKFAVHDQAIFLNLPLDINIRRPSGLFTVEGEGKVILHLKTKLQFDKELRVSSKTSLEGYEWTEKPTLQLGVLSMSVETLIDLILEHSESLITGKIDKSIKENANLKGIIHQYIYSKIQNLPFLVNNGINLNTSIDRLVINTFRTENEKFNLKAKIHVDIAVANEDTPENYPIIVFEEAIEEIDAGVRIPIALSYDSIAKMAMQNLSAIEIGGKNVEIGDLKIAFDQKIMISGVINQPSRMVFNVSGEPTYAAETESISMNDVNINVKPDNFIYKVFSPLVESYAENKLAKIFPFNLTSFLKNRLSKVPTSFTKKDIKNDINWKEVKISDVTFEKDYIGLVLVAYGLKLEISDV